MFKLSFVLYELAWTAVFFAALIHGGNRWGIGRTAAFFIPAVAFGWLLEWGFQTLYGGYHYGEGFLLYAANVPVSVALTWATLAYWGYWLVSVKLRIRHTLVAPALTALFMVVVDALHFEPMAYWFGYWSWTQPGPWFGASADNFLLWFLTPLMQLSVFQWADAKDWPAWKRLLLGLALVPIQFGLLVILMGLLGPLMVAR